MKRINGFDERMAYGIGYDDDEIIARIRMLGVQMIIKDDISVIHQYHESLWSHPNATHLCTINRRHLEEIKRINKPYANTIPLWSGI